MPKNETPKSINRVTCGCCSNGCVCFNHQDTPRGRPPQKCEVHAAPTSDGCHECIVHPARDRESDLRWEPLPRCETKELLGASCQLPDCDEHEPESDGPESVYCGICSFPHDEHENGECVKVTP